MVDNLSDYFKLINWIYCQENTYIKGERRFLPTIIYVDQGDEQVVEKMRCMQLYFRNLTDFSGKFSEEIKRRMRKNYNGTFMVESFHYFDENPLTYCTSRIQFEDVIQLSN